MPAERSAFLYAAITVILWSTVASAFKLSLLYLTPLQLLFYANIASVATLFLLLLSSGKLGELLSLSLAKMQGALLLGLLNPLLYYLILFQAYDLLPAQEAQPINYTWAITLSLLSVPLLGHRLTRTDLVAILICYSGVLVIATHGNLLALSFSSPFGVFLALISTLVWSLYWIFNTRNTLDPVISLFLNFCFALPFVAALTWFSGGLVPVEIKGIAGAVYVGVFEMGVAFVLWLKAMRLTGSAVRIATLIYFAPFISLFLIHLLVGEDIRWSSILGLAMIVAGNLFQRRHKIKPRQS